MVSLSCKISPLTLTVIFFDRSPSCDGRRDFSDVANLRGQIRRHRVDAFGQVFPGSSHTHDICLAAEPAFGADFARDPRHLAGKPVELVNHRIDGFLELQNLSADVDRNFLREVPAGDRRRDFGDVSNLRRQIAGHRVDAVSQVLPCPGDAQHLRLTAEPAFGANFARNARHLGRKSVELIDHRVDGVLQLENLAPHIDGDLAGKIAACDRGRNLGDVAHLVGQIAAHRVDAVGEIFPRAGDPWHERLAAELAFCTDFASHARHFRREGAKLIDHRVDGFLQLKDFAPHVDRDLLGKVAVRDRDRHLGDVAHLPGEVARHRVDALGQIPPYPGHFTNLRLPAEFSVSADFASDARDLGREHAELFDHRVDDFRRAQKFSLKRTSFHIERNGLLQVALRDGRDRVRNGGRRPKQIVDQGVDRTFHLAPCAGADA